MTDNILYTMPSYYRDNIVYNSDKLIKLDMELLSKILRNSVQKPAGFKSDLPFGHVPIRVNLVVYNSAYSTPAISMLFDEYDDMAFFGDYMVSSDLDPIRSLVPSYSMSVYIPAIYGVLRYYVPGEARNSLPNFILNTPEDCDFALRQFLYQFADVYDENSIVISKDLYYWYGDDTMHICILCKCDRREYNTFAVPLCGKNRYANIGLVSAVLNTDEVFNL